MKNCTEDSFIKLLSFGAELEWSDIDRTVDIPEEWGSWEGPKIAGYNLGSELDIVNTKGEWRGIATDPLCTECPVGGEIHVNPSYTIDSQMIRIMRIMGRFDTVGVACPNHGHIHVGIPGVRKDLKLIKNLFAYTEKNEIDVLRWCAGIDLADRRDYTAILEDTMLEDWVKQYLIVGDAKSITPRLYERIREAQTVEDAMVAMREEDCWEYDWIADIYRKAPGSHRTCVNLFNLTKSNTVEFRAFRASINPVEIYSTLMFSQRYIEEALKGEDGKSVIDILLEGNYRFPKLNFNGELAEGWQRTRHSKGRSGCLKHYTGFCMPSEDRAMNGTDLDTEEEGMRVILDLCKKDFNG